MDSELCVLTLCLCVKILNFVQLKFQTETLNFLNLEL